MFNDKIMISKLNSRLSIKNENKDFLTINFEDLSMQVTKKQDVSLGSQIFCDGVFGILSLLEFNFLIAITKSETICVIQNEHKISKILETTVVSLQEKEEIPNEIKSILDSVQAVLETGFYFSNTFDLSNNLSAQREMQKISNFIYDIVIEANPNCLANFNFISKFSMNNIGENFLSSCIYGSIQKIEYDFPEQKNIKCILISRRCVPNFSIKQFKRGLDKRGYIADQVETEIIIEFCKKHYFSYVMVSSTVPCYYSDVLPKKGTKIIKAYSEYVKNLIDEYSLICFIDVQDETDNTVNEKFRRLVINREKERESRNIKYYKINSNEYQDEKNIENFFTEKKDVIDLLFFYAKGPGMKYDQRGILAFTGSNYQDISSLEKYLGWYIVKKQLQLFGYEINKMEKEKEEFFKAYSSLWDKNSSLLVVQYYHQMEEHDARNYQRLMRILFGIPLKKKKTIEQELSFFKKNFSQKGKINLYTATWNVGASDPKKKTPDFKEWLIPKGANEKIIPDIYFIGLQEAVELNTMNVISKSKEVDELLEVWSNLIEDTISQGNRIKYERATLLNLVGIVFFVYFRADKAKNISKFKVKKIKTGLGGAAGNKGSCMVNFDYFNTTISVACSHLAAGISKNANRVSEINDILNSKFSTNQEELQSDLSRVDAILPDNFKEIQPLVSEDFDSKYLPTFQESDAWFLFGDLNFRIDTDYENSLDYIKNNDWKNLEEFDQLFKSKTALINFKDGIDEAKITFPPTYKFALGTNEYDQKKKRIPSWCDRILFKKYNEDNETDKYIFPLEYNYVINGGFNCSDHRPIYGIFEIIVLEDIKNIKQKYENEIKYNSKFEISSSYMKKNFSP